MTQDPPLRNEPMPIFIEKKPAFNELFELAASVKDVQRMIVSLSDEGDTVQRATDLYFAIEELQKQAKQLLTETDEETDED